MIKSFTTFFFVIVMRNEGILLKEQIRNDTMRWHIKIRKLFIIVEVGDIKHHNRSTIII